MSTIEGVVGKSRLVCWRKAGFGRGGKGGCDGSEVDLVVRCQKVFTLIEPDE